MVAPWAIRPFFQIFPPVFRVITECFPGQKTTEKPPKNNLNKDVDFRREIGYNIKCYRVLQTQGRRPVPQQNSPPFLFAWRSTQVAIRGAPAKGVGVERRAGVRIPASPPKTSLVRPLLAIRRGFYLLPERFVFRNVVVSSQFAYIFLGGGGIMPSPFSLAKTAFVLNK